MNRYPIALFVLAALIARGIRYYGLAWLVLRYGPKVERLWRRHAVVTSLVADEDSHGVGDPKAEDGVGGPKAEEARPRGWGWLFACPPSGFAGPPRRP